MSRRKPSYTRLCLAARAIHETYYSLLRDSSWKANDEIKLIRLDPLNPKFLDRIIVELAATFDFPDALSLQYYIRNQLKIPEKRRYAPPKLRPVVRQPKVKTKVNGKAQFALDDMAAKFYAQDAGLVWG